jgi:peptide/nickel transport system substrate-binding protein
MLTSASSARAAAPTGGNGVPRVSLPDFPATDQSIAVGTGASWAQLLATSSLLNATPEGRILGGLAIAWILSPGRDQLDLQIRPDALFADGSLVTPADVLASLGRARDLVRNTRESWRWEHVQSVTIVETGLVRLSLSEPDASVPALLSSSWVPILPATWIVKGWDPGNGPYPPSSGCFQPEFATPERLRYSRNDGFYQIGRPRLAGVICHAPSDTVPRTTQLVTGVVDLLIDAPLLDVPTLREDPGITLVGGPTNRLCLLAVNLRSAAVADARLRRLISSAIDREGLVQAATANEATPATTLIPVDHWAGLDLAAETADPDDVRAQLEALGAPPGIELRLVASDADASLANACVLLQEQLAWAGIALSLDLLDDTEFEAEMSQGTWDMAMTYTGYWRDPHELIRPLVVSDGSFNAGNYANDRVDYLATLASRARNDEFRGDLYRTIQRIVAEDVPVIPLFFPNYFDAMSTELEDYPFHTPVSAAAMSQATMAQPDPVALP